MAYVKMSDFNKFLCKHFGKREPELTEKTILEPAGIVWRDPFGYVRVIDGEKSKTVPVEEVESLVCG